MMIQMTKRTTPIHFLLLLAILSAVMPACKRNEGCTDPTSINYDPDAEKDDGSCIYASSNDVIALNTNFNTNTTLVSGETYMLFGFVEVESGVVLTIEPGTLILGDKDTKGTLIVNRGAQIIAEGTAAAPIVFTSAEPAGSRAPGDWGGVIICGRAPVNLPGGSGVVEGGVEAVFGGTDPADNSGKFKYVRIEYPGIAFQPNNEINGLTLAGVGSGTEIDHVQVRYSGDDSFEFFGGTVNTKNLVALAGLDDDFDMDNGYSGNGQFFVALRDPNQADASGSNGMEHDNDGSGTTATPHTTPVLTNVSIYGPQAEASTVINGNFKRAMHLRRNTNTRVFNSVFAGFPTGLLIDGSACEANADAGALKVKNCVFSAMSTLLSVASGSTWDITSWFNANGNTTYGDNAVLGVIDAFDLTDPDMRLATGSPLASGAQFGDVDLGHPFFSVVAYKGAFNDDDWTAGWCDWDPQQTIH